MFSPTVEQLTTLDAVIEEGSFERAAVALSITPSAVSQRMKALEQAVGQVVVRRSTPTTVTEAGAVVLRYARQVRLLGEETARALGIDDGGWTEVPIAVSAEALEAWFLDLVDHLPASPAIGLRLLRYDEHHTTGPLRDGTVVAALTVSPEPVQGCSVEALGSMPYLAVSTPALATRARTGGLASIPVVQFDDDDPMQTDLLRRLDEPAPTARHQLPTTGAFGAGIRRGLGWGFMPRSTISDDLRSGALVPVVDDAAHDVVLYWQRWNLDSAVLDAVTGAVRAAAADHLSPR